jgi:hypothetical protein
MQKLLLIAAAFGVSAAPGFAQTTPAPTQPAPSQAAPAPQKKVTKLVCREVEEERGIGSRLSSTTKICKRVEVPAPTNGQQAQQPPSRDGIR